MITKSFSRRFFIILVATTALSYIGLQIYQNKDQLRNISTSLHNYRSQTQNILPQPTTIQQEPQIDPTQTLVPTRIITTAPPINNYQNPQDSDNTEWGIAKEVDEGTYTIRVGSDEKMGTPQEVYEALNAYRSVNGRSQLTWDDSLAAYAQSRADLFKSQGNTDKHAGFNNYLENEDGFNKLGFRHLGENSYFGGPLTGTHMIEWVFAKSPGHDANQKDASWSHVGVGVTDTSANLIFAGQKM